MGPMNIIRIQLKFIRPPTIRSNVIAVMMVAIHARNEHPACKTDFFKLAKREELMEDPAFQSHANRLNNSKKVYAVLAEIVVTQPLARWVRDLDANNIPVMVVQTKVESWMD